MYLPWPRSSKSSFIHSTKKLLFWGQLLGLLVGELAGADYGDIFRIDVTSSKKEVINFSCTKW